MKIRWLAHSSFLLTADDGTKVLTDPYEPGGFGGNIGHGPFGEAVSIVTVSHEHGDHNYVQGLAGKPTVIHGLQLAKGAGEQTIGKVKLKAVLAYHDGKRGSDRGEDAIFAISIDGIAVAHCGDLGHVLTPDQVKAVGPVDVLLIPVGGFYTIDAAQATQVVEQLEPKMVIPMHVKTDKLNFPIALVDDFLRGKTNVERTGRSEIQVTVASLPTETKIVVLEPSL